MIAIWPGRPLESTKDCHAISCAAVRFKDQWGRSSSFERQERKGAQTAKSTVPAIWEMVLKFGISVCNKAMSYTQRINYQIGVFEPVPVPVAAAGTVIRACWMAFSPLHGVTFNGRGDLEKFH